MGVFFHTRMLLARLRVIEVFTRGCSRHEHRGWGPEELKNGFWAPARPPCQFGGLGWLWFGVV